MCRYSLGRVCSVLVLLTIVISNTGLGGSSVNQTGLWKGEKKTHTVVEEGGTEDRNHLSEKQSGNERPELSREIIFMMLLAAGLIGLFFWEPIPIYAIALGIPVTLVLFQQCTGISTADALRGFSSEATLTIMAMFILSEGIQKSGFIQILGNKLTKLSGSNLFRQLGLITGLSGPTAGIINNTPVVAIFIPMVSNMARRLKTSPSKLMIPLSYAAMMGGTLTLIGSSTNLLASDMSADLLNHPIGFFEFTVVGICILLIGSLYLIFVSPSLIPDRIDPEQDLAEEYEMGVFLTELVLEEEASIVGKNVREALDGSDLEFDLVRIIRDEEHFMEPLQIKTLREGDRLIIQAEIDTLLTFLDTEGVKLWSRARVSEEKLEEEAKGEAVIETVIPSGSFLEGQTLRDVNFVDRYDATVMAIRRGEELSHRGMEDITIHAGDVLLLLATETTANRLRKNRNFIVAGDIEEEEFRQEKMTFSLGILGAVVALAAMGMVPIAISALAGAIVMCVTRCVDPNDLHEAVDWEVIFLLAGLIPLGRAMEKTGTAEFLALTVLDYTHLLPPLGILAVFYMITAVMTNLIHKNASIVLMIPIAVDAAVRLGLEPFPFLITVMMASSTAFLTPVGNQTNLMIYGPGGYRFSDFFRVGLPLQILLAIVTPLVVSLWWPL